MIQAWIGILVLMLSPLATSSPSFAQSAAPEPSETPSTAEEETADVDPTSKLKAWTLVGTYGTSAYGSGAQRALQIVPREEIARLGSSILRVNLPALQSVPGVDSGFGDMQLFYQFVNRFSRQRATAVGFSMWFPTANSPAFGTGKWSIGPAATYIELDRRTGILDGFLMQSFFSYAGPSWRANQALITLQPGIVKTFGNGWSLRSADATWAFDLQRGSAIMPISLGFGRLFRFRKQALNLVLADSLTVVHANAPRAPKNQVKFLVRIMYPRNYPPR